MKFNNDGFNQRMNYIHNSNDMNKLRKNGPSNFDNSFAKMRVEERRNMVETTNQDKVFISNDVKGNKENFLIRNNNMRQSNSKPSSDNPVSNARNRNMFKKNEFNSFFCNKKLKKIIK